MPLESAGEAVRDVSAGIKRLSGMIGATDESGAAGRVFSIIEVLSMTDAPSNPDESITAGSDASGIGAVINESVGETVRDVSAGIKRLSGMIGATDESVIDVASIIVAAESTGTASVSATFLSEIIAAVSISEPNLDSIANVAASPAPLTNSGQSGLLILLSPT